jgi:hypothetical protein
MSFGKRRPSAAASRTAPAPDPENSKPEQTSEQRYLAARDTMLRLLATTASIADAMREDEEFPITGLDTELQAFTTPLDIVVFDEHFTFVSDGKTLHSVFGYILPEAPSKVDNSAQLHLHALAARIMELNLYCQRAKRDEALRVALQSPKLPTLIDRILVGAAFFAAYFENLVITQPMMGDGTTLSAPLFGMKSLATNMERRRLMAADRMMEPKRLEEHLPFRKWPFMGVEILAKPHVGQRFSNKVYFPKLLTTPNVPALLRGGSLSAA